MVKHDAGIGQLEGINLAARGDGDRYFIGISGSHNKDDVLGWLLECFEKSVESRFGEHMHFINNINFIFAFCWGDDGLFA